MLHKNVCIFLGQSQISFPNIYRPNLSSVFLFYNFVSIYFSKSLVSFSYISNSRWWLKIRIASLRRGKNSEWKADLHRFALLYITLLCFGLLCFAPLALWSDLSILSSKRCVISGAVNRYQWMPFRNWSALRSKCDLNDDVLNNVLLCMI